MHLNQPKIILHGQDALLKAFKGVETLAKTVSATMGSHGRMILIDRGRFNEPVFSRDGVSVAKEVGIEDPVEASGYSVVFEASRRTNEEAGDGTTNSIVLAHAMIEEGIKHVLARRNVLRLSSGMVKAAQKILEKMKEVTKKINFEEELISVATISAQDSEIGRVVAEVMTKVGAEGSVVTDINPGGNSIDWVLQEGMHIQNGFYSPFFITDPKRLEYNEEGVYVLVCGDSIEQATQIAPIMEKLLEKHKEEGKGTLNLLVIAPAFRDFGIDFFVKNKMNGLLRPVLVKAPLSGQYMRGILEDIAIKTGGTFHYSEDGTPLPTTPAEANATSFGFAERVIVGKDKTVIVGGMGDTKKIEERADFLRSMQKETTEAFDKETYGERISSLTSGVGVVRISAKTEAQTEELRFRVEDALCAAKAALSEGTVPGGGVALLRAAQLAMIDDDLRLLDDDEMAGAQIVLAAVRKPAWQIATNAGESGEVIVHEILKRGEDGDSLDIGYNLNTRRYENMREAGVIDPAKAIRSALENSVGVASAFLTMGGSITTKHQEVPEKK